MQSFQALATSLLVLLLAAGLAPAATAVDESYSIFTVPLPEGFVPGADDQLVPYGITDDGSWVLFTVRKRSTGVETWYSYWMVNGGSPRPVALPSLLTGFQHLRYNGVFTGSGAVFGQAWNTDGNGVVTSIMPVLTNSGHTTVSVFGTLQGRFTCADGSGPNLYGQVFALPTSGTAGPLGRAGFWIYGFTGVGAPLANTPLERLTAVVESEASRTSFSTIGSYTNGDYIAGTHTQASGAPGFWRYLRPVGSASTFTLVPPPAALGAAYAASTGLTWANCGVVRTGEAAYRVGSETDAAVPMVSFLFDGAASTVIVPPTGLARNVMRCTDIAKYGATITAVGFAKQRSGTTASGTDSNATAWIWHQGDAHATALQALVPRPATPRLGSNAAGISLGLSEFAGGEIVIDGFDPATTGTTPAEQRILVLARIPTLTLQTSATTMAESPQARVDVSYARLASDVLPDQVAVAYVLGGTAVRDVDYFLEFDSTVISDDGTRLVVKGGHFQLLSIDNHISAPDKTITVTLDATGSGYQRTDAYRVAGATTITLELVNDDHGAAVTLTRTGNATATAPVAISAAFSTPVTGFTASDVAASAGSITTVGGSGAGYTLTWTPPADSSGSATITIPEGVAGSASGGFPNLPSNALVIIYDTDRPHPTLVSDVNPITAASGAWVSARFNEPIASAMNAAYFTVNGGSITPGSFAQDTNGCSVHIDFTGPVVTVAFAAGVVSDAAGNTNVAAPSLTFQHATDPVTVTVEQAPGQADPAGVLPVRFLVTFSQPVSGFSLGDMQFGGTTSMFMQADVANPSGDLRTFVVSITDMTAGTVTASVLRDTVMHGSIPNAASSSVDGTVTYAPGGAGGGTPTPMSPGSGGNGGGGCGLGSGVAFLAVGTLGLFARLRRPRRLVDMQ